MRTLAFLLPWLVWVSHGRRLQASTKQAQSSLDRETNDRALVGILLESSHSPAFVPSTPGVRIPAARIAKGTSSHALRSLPPARTASSLPMMSDGDPDPSVTDEKEGAVMSDGDADSDGAEDEEDTEVVYVDEKIIELVFKTLLSQPGFLNSTAGCTVTTLCDLTEDDPLIAQAEDFEDIYDACDVLEEEGVIKVVQDEENEESVLYLSDEKAQALKEGRLVLSGDLRQYMKEAGLDASSNVALASQEEKIAQLLDDEIDKKPLPPEANDVVVLKSTTDLDALPDEVVLYDPQKHLKYDYEQENMLASKLYMKTNAMKRMGLTKEDEEYLGEIKQLCLELSMLSADSPAPPLNRDPRIMGDWQLVASTSDTVKQRQGLTTLGTAPFTKFGALFYRFLPNGDAIAKEILEMFGRPCVLNELRGRFGFTQDGKYMQEEYTQADVSGERNNPAFRNAVAQMRHICITYDGGLRLASAGDGGYLVYKKIKPGALEDYLAGMQLPWVGGTQPDMTKEELAVAYPYMNQEDLDKRKGGGPFPFSFR